MSARKSRRGFTLVELLAVVAIIGTLIGLLLPAVHSARESARRSQCMNSLKQFSLACANYADARKVFPSSTILLSNNSCPTDSYTGVDTARFSVAQKAPWTVMVLPYLEQQALYDQFMKAAGNWCAIWSEDSPDRGSVNALQQKRNASFLCPTDPAVAGMSVAAGIGATTPLASTSYYAVTGGGSATGASTCAQPGTTTPQNLPICVLTGYYYGASGVMFLNSKTKLSHILDGTSKSLLFGESRSCQKALGSSTTEVSWASSIWVVGGVNSYILSQETVAVNALNTACDPFKANCKTVRDRTFGSYHMGGATFAIADGSLVFLEDSLDVAVLRNLGNAVDGAGTLP